MNVNISRHRETNNANTLLATGVFTSAELYRLSKASIIQPQSPGLPHVIKLEPNVGSYYCNNYSPDDPNDTLAVSIPVSNLSSGGAGNVSVMTSAGHNTHLTISHTASTSSPGSDVQHQHHHHNTKRQRRLTTQDDTDPDKGSSDLQYYAQSWQTDMSDHVPGPQHLHMSPHVKIKQEVLPTGQHYHCSQSPKELSNKSINDSHHREGIANQLKDSYLSHSHSPVLTSSSGSGLSIGQISSQNAYYSLPPGKYQENGDTLSDFVNLVCQEAQNNGNGPQGPGSDMDPNRSPKQMSNVPHHQPHHHYYNTSISMLPPPPPAPMARPVPIIRSPIESC
ncbi:unnamed protein product, partial [Oppiella nova]